MTAATTSGERWLPWLVRAAWATLPLAGGDTFAAMLDSWSTGPRGAASALLWVGWATVAVATVIALPFALTILRVGTAAGVAACLWSLSPATPLALCAFAAALRPEVAEWYVNGPAYPNERRYPLRVPGALLLGPLWLAAAAAIAAPVAAVMLLADRQWVLGAVATAAGGALGAVAARALHGLSRRWIVFVPAGVVLHDPLSLADPVLLPRKVIESMHAAPAGSDSLDLTQGALGLAVELTLREKVPMVRRVGGRDEPGASARVLIMPTRPGRVLAEAARRRVSVAGPEEAT